MDLESFNGIAGYAGLTEPSDFINNILICVLKMNEGLTGVERHEALAMLKLPGTTTLFHLVLSSPNTKETKYKACKCTEAVSPQEPSKLLCMTITWESLATS